MGLFIPCLLLFRELFIALLGMARCWDSSVCHEDAVETRGEVGGVVLPCLNSPSQNPGEISNKACSQCSLRALSLQGASSPQTWLISHCGLPGSRYFPPLCSDLWTLSAEISSPDRFHQHFSHSETQNVDLIASMLGQSKLNTIFNPNTRPQFCQPTLWLRLPMARQNINCW